MARYEKDTAVYPTAIQVLLYDLRLYGVRINDIEKGFPHLSNIIRKWHEEHDREGIRKTLDKKCSRKRLQNR